MAQGYEWRERRRAERDAWLLANLLQPHSRRHLRPRDFLAGRQPALDRQAQFDELWRRVSAARQSGKNSTAGN